MELQQRRSLLYLNLDPKEISEPKELLRDVSEIGHFGTGNLEISLKTLEDFEEIKLLLDASYQKVGG